MPAWRAVVLVAALSSVVSANPLPDPWPWIDDEALYLPLEDGLTASRVTIDGAGRIVLAGGSNDDGGENFTQRYSFVFDPRAPAWYPLAPLGESRCLHGMATDVLGRPVVFGGYRDGTALSSVEAYDATRQAWIPLRSLPVPLSQCTAVADPTGESIFVLGGSPLSTNSLPTNRVFRYHVATDTWTEAAPMLRPRLGHVAALGPDGKIYAFGGWGGGPTDPDETGSTVERMDPATGTWEEVASMHRHPHIPGAAASDRCRFIYVLGGYLGDYWDDIERLDVWTGAWEPVSGLLGTRNNMAAVVDDTGTLYVIGGDAGYDEVRNVEYLVVSDGPCVPDADLPRRGDFDGDDRVTLTDAVGIAVWKVHGSPAPGCVEAADANADGLVGLDDAVFTLEHLFRGGPWRVKPVLTCGAGP